MWNAGLDEAQAGIKIAGWSTSWIKIAGRNITYLRYASDTILVVES